MKLEYNVGKRTFDIVPGTNHSIVLSGCYPRGTRVDLIIKDLGHDVSYEQQKFFEREIKNYIKEKNFKYLLYDYDLYFRKVDSESEFQTLYNEFKKLMNFAKFFLDKIRKESEKTIIYEIK